MKKIFLLIVIIYLNTPIDGVFGQSKAGTSAAPFLSIGVGARAIGMGEAYVGISNDALALFWNPGGLTLIDGVSFTTTHTEWFAGLTHDFAGISVPLGNGAIGASVTFLMSDDIEITTLLEPNGTGLFYNATDVAFGISYAYNLLDRFSVGVTGKYIQQKLVNESASSIAIDIGTILITGFKSLRIGMSLTNLGGAMKMDGPDLVIPYNVGGNVAITPDIKAQLSTEEWPLPTNFRIGVAVDLVGQPGNSFIPNEISRLTLAIDGNHPTDNEERGNIGIEYSWNNTLALRTGYKFNYSEQGFTFGGGLNIGLGGALIGVDYALAEFGDLGYVHRFTLGFTL
jgi:hypothetical protein